MMKLIIFVPQTIFQGLFRWYLDFAQRKDNSDDHWFGLYNGHLDHQLSAQLLGEHPGPFRWNTHGIFPSEASWEKISVFGEGSDDGYIDFSLWSHVSSLSSFVTSSSSSRYSAANRLASYSIMVMCFFLDYRRKNPLNDLISSLPRKFFKKRAFCSSSLA